MNIDLPDSFRTVLAVMASDWYQKPFFVFFVFLPSQKPANLGVVSCVFIREEHEVQLFAMFIYAVRESFILCTR